MRALRPHPSAAILPARTGSPSLTRKPPMPHPVPRWCERFDTFHHAFMRLQEALEIARPLTPLEQEV